jgi:hypothetical protein
VRNGLRIVERRGVKAMRAAKPQFVGGPGTGCLSGIQGGDVRREFGGVLWKPAAVLFYVEFLAALEPSTDLLVNQLDIQHFVQLWKARQIVLKQRRRFRLARRAKRHIDEHQFAKQQADLPVGGVGQVLLNLRSLSVPPGSLKAVADLVEGQRKKRSFWIKPGRHDRCLPTKSHE